MLAIKVEFYLNLVVFLFISKNSVAQNEHENIFEISIM